MPDPASYRAFFLDVVANWGSERTRTLRDFAPSLQVIPSMAAWVPRYERASASPAMIGSLMESGFRLDITPLLPHIDKPALVVHLSADRVIPLAFGKLLAARLPRAKLLELPGDDHFAWVSPHVDTILDAIFAFTGTQGEGPRVTAPWDPWSALTPSERRVAGLVRRGMTNAEIAKTLSLSTRTVENHLARIFAKLGVRSRTELALRRE